MISSQTDERYEQARGVLARHWGYPDFRPGQRDVVRAVLQNRDVLAVLPTGGGKSICYQVPAVVDEGITIVISPLIALMQDQVDGLRRAGVRAAFMNSTMSARAIDQCWIDLKYGLYRLVYVAPERLTTDDFVERARELRIARVAVDEAHCISEWGHNFRPSYLQIADAVEQIGRPPVVAVTATATPRVRADIREFLRLSDPETIVSGFDRPNIVWSVFHDENKRRHVRRVIDGVGGSGIVYAATRRSTESWAEWLRSEGISAAAYHAGLSSEKRLEVQNAWLGGDIRVVTATNAFGMGIDKPDVRYVIHVQMPGSLEAYYQEAGRGGRDGGRSHAVMIFHPSDVDVQRRLIEGAHPPVELVRRVYDVLCSMGGVAVGAASEDLLVLDRPSVLRALDASPGQIERAIDVLEQGGAWRRVLIDGRSGLLRFDAGVDQLKSAAARKGGAFEGFVSGLLRSIDAAAFGGWTAVQPDYLGRKTGLSAERVEAGLDFLAARGFCTWRPARDAILIELADVRAARVRIDVSAMERSLQSSRRKLDDMVQYASGSVCRRRHLLAYFGERLTARCGRCDVCLGRHRDVVVTPKDEPALRSMLEHIAAEHAAPVIADDRSYALLRWLEANKHAEADLAEPWRWSVTQRGRRYLGGDA